MCHLAAMSSPLGGFWKKFHKFRFQCIFNKNQHTHSIIIQLRIKTHIGRGSAPLTWFPWLNFGIVVNSLLILNDLPLAFSPNSASKLHSNLTTLKIRVLFSEYIHNLPKPFFLPHIGLLKVP